MPLINLLYLLAFGSGILTLFWFYFSIMYINQDLLIKIGMYIILVLLAALCIGIVLYCWGIERIEL